MTEQLLRPSVSVRSVIFDPSGSILILQRDSDHDWELPGGRLSSYEGVSEGLRREIREETSLSINIKDILLANSWINDQNNDRLGVYYVSNAERKRVRLSQEHTDFMWVTPTEATHKLSAAQAKAIQLSCDKHVSKPVLDI
ncbi:MULTISPECIES: NUDIX domain-containing protein [Halorubrum]|uniref:ADP-ribose pyrophosphatase n=1 Tax=Halorubrum ezzemoulense TaxID=337243 RepID=A0A256JLE6_HALEZ|nr:MULTISPECIES: NUDIX domain-containing protein [Halorubrum]MDB2262048.1 NUDIX domain-containing protein [Halorubrum ezzemoulense]MDB2268895.1 NUDIX domain-containing protein [Halorubrum ezzemoulense]MDB2282636.1 NUDIX domain-containing protein [Halorubrum ezzemoulense]OYR69376.1 ADP-ribose pyrophosphatase [Halorubrum ezzemoulense]TKX37609.1 NUDIX domain-containing protein [Halorubrum sp. CGM5_25_10-8B]